MNELKQRFIGCWKLLSINIKHGASVLHPFGKHVKGMLFYGKDHMSVQIMMPVHYPLAHDRKLTLKLEELAHSSKTAGYMGYWGSWHINSESHTLIHKVEGSIAQPIVHKNEIRKFRFEDGKLILSSGPLRLSWQRVE